MKYTESENFAFFNINCRLYLKRCGICWWLLWNVNMKS